ncbi:MAG: AsmA-like C-terminal region-containing protein [Wolbachia sp.]|nr:AsmA-like C-terminal region-containing protein [Wolbachia sp.]
MKFSLYTILLTSLILTFMHIAVSFKDWNGCKEYIIRELEKTYDAEIHIGGKVEVSLITPRLTIHNVYIQYNEHKEQKLSDLISINKIEVRPSFLSLFLFSLQPKTITLFGMKSNKENLLHIVDTKISNNIVDVAIKDSHINLEDNCINIKEINVKKNKNFSGEVKIGDNYYDFSGKINITKKNVNINVESNLINLVFTGDRDQEALQGNLTLTVNNYSNSLGNLVKIINLNILSHLIPNESIKILSNVSINENELTITDLKVDSNSIQASGKIHNNRKNDHTNVNVSFSKVDLDFIQNDPQKKIGIKDLLECFRKSIPKDLSLNFSMKAFNINYQKKILDDFRAVLKFANNEVTVNTLLKLPGINNISYLSGKVSNNNMLSEFNGNLLVEGNDFKSVVSYFFPAMKIDENKTSQFTFRSELHFAPRTLSISDIRLLNGREFSQGSIKVSYTKNHNIIDGGFSIYNLNADKYDFSSLSKIQWLKNFKYNVNIKVNMNDFMLNDTKIKGVDFLLNMEKGKLATNKIKLHGDNFDITGNTTILMDQKYAKPLLDISLKGNKFNGNIIKLPSLIEKKNNSRNEITQIKWSTKQFNFLSNIEGLDANIHINTEEFKTEQSVLKSFNLDAVIRNNTVTVRKMAYILEHGQIIFQGYLRPDSMYTKFLITNLEINKISEMIGISNIKGQVSLSGIIKTQGKNFYDWANNSSGEINLEAQGVKFSNVDFNSFITNLLGSKNKSEISTFANVDIYKGSTFFKNISGKASIVKGVCATSLQFCIDQASGSISANLTLSNFTLVSIFRFFFIPLNYSSPIHIDMNLDGPIWRPKMSFDIDKIFLTLIGKKNN